MGTFNLQDVAGDILKCFRTPVKMLKGIVGEIQADLLRREEAGPRMLLPTHISANTTVGGLDRCLVMEIEDMSLRLSFHGQLRQQESCY